MRWKTYLLSGTIILLAMLIIFSIDIGGNITGLFVFEEVAPEGFEFTPPEEVSELSASDSIEKAEIEIIEMENLNLPTLLAEDALTEARSQYRQGNYLEVLKLTQLISFIKKEKIEFLDLVELTRRKEQQFKEDGVDTAEGLSLIDRSLEAFALDQLVDAQNFLQQAAYSLDAAKKEKDRRQSIIYLGKSFFLRYWRQILLVLILLGFISIPTAKKIIRDERKKKLARLKIELEKTQELIKKLQKQCFVDKKITVDSYKSKTAKYELRTAEIKHTIPVIEAQLEKKTRKIKNKPKGAIEVKRR